MSTIVEQVAKHEWRKDWEGSFSLLVCDISVPPYYHESLQELGTNTDKVFIAYKNGTATCFLSAKGDATFGKDLREIVDRNPELLVQWSERVKRDHDEVRKFIARPLPEFLEKEMFTAFVRTIRIYCAYLGAIKAIANTFPPERLEDDAQCILEARKYTEKLFFDVEKTIDTVTASISATSGYEPRFLTALSVSELVTYTDKHTLPPKELLKARYERSSFLYAETTTEFSAEETDAIEAMIYGSSIGEVFGNGNRLGVVQGIARVITNFSQEKDQFQKGEILVTGMTDPNFVPLMKSSVAIVTDQGGMLSHAAIVARELGIPCVIGTERATRAFTTGQMIEVDTEKGIVRKL